MLILAPLIGALALSFGSAAAANGAIVATSMLNQSAVQRAEVPSLPGYNDGFVEVDQFYRQGPAFRICPDRPGMRVVAHEGQCARVERVRHGFFFPFGGYHYDYHPLGEGLNPQGYLDERFGWDTTHFVGVSSRRGGEGYSLVLFYTLKQSPAESSAVNPPPKLEIQSLPDDGLKLAGPAPAPDTWNTAQESLEPAQAPSGKPAQPPAFDIGQRFAVTAINPIDPQTAGRDLPAPVMFFLNEHSGCRMQARLEPAARGLSLQISPERLSCLNADGMIWETSIEGHTRIIDHQGGPHGRYPTLILEVIEPILLPQGTHTEAGVG